MKNAAFKTIVFCILMLSVKVDFSQDRPNNLEIMNIEIARPDKKAHVNMHSSKNELLKVFGKPLKTEDYYFEMDDKHGFVVKYKGADFYYEDNKLTGFYFNGTTANFLIGLKDQHAFSGIGKPITQFKKLKFAKGGGFFNVQNFGVDTEEILSFQTNQDQLVTKIFFTIYNPRQEQELTLNQ